MLKALSSLVLLCTIAFADTPPPPPAVIIQDSTTVKSLRGNMNVNNVLSYLTGNLNPSLSAVSANKGSIYSSTLTGLTYSKTDSGSSTNWVANSGDLTLTTVGAVPNANGASISGQVLRLQPANASFPGALIAADWTTFNNKAPTANPTFTGQVTVPAGTTGAPSIKFGSNQTGFFKDTSVGGDTINFTQNGLLTASLVWNTYPTSAQFVMGSNTLPMGLSISGYQLTLNSSDSSTQHNNAITGGNNFADTLCITSDTQIDCSQGGNIKLHARSASNPQALEFWNSGIRSGYVSSTNHLLWNDGGTASPSYSFVSAPTYGVWYSSGLHIAANSLDAASVDSSAAWVFGVSGGSASHTINGFATVQATGSSQFVVKDTASHGTTGAPTMTFKAASTSLGQFGFPTANTNKFVLNAIGAAGNFEFQLNSVANTAVSTAGIWAFNNPSAATGTLAPSGYIKVKSDGTNVTGTDGILVVGDAVQAKISLASYGDANKFRGFRASGTAASPTATTASSLSNFEGYGYDGTTFAQGGYIAIQSGSTWSGSNHETYLRFGGTTLNSAVSGDFGTWKSTGITAAGLNVSGLTASTVPYLNSSKDLTSSAVTPTQLSYVDATSSIQTQLDTKSTSASPTFTGTVTMPSGTITSSAWDTGTSTFTSNGVAFTSKAPLASPTFTGTVTLPSGSVSSSAWDTGTSTFTSNGVAFTAKAPLASPTFTGTVTLPSGSVTSSAWSTGTSTFTSNGVAFTDKAPLASPTFTGVVSIASGLVGAPGLAFSAAPTYGVWYDSGNTRTALAAGGVETFSVDSATMFGLLDFRMNGAQTSGAQFIIRNRVNDGSGCVYGGGTSTSSGMCFFGDSHATTPGQILFKDAGATTLTFTAGGAFQASAGSVSAPTYSFGAYTSSGWYATSGPTLNAAISGAQKLYLDASGLNVASLTASRVVVTDSSKYLTSAATTATEIGYVNGVTSAIQTQLNAKAPAFAEFDSGNTSTAKTIDWTNGVAQKSTLTGNVTYTFTAPANVGSPLVIRVLTGAGSFTATWPATVKWAAGTAPVITTTASRMDLINFYYDGTDYYGSYTQNYTP